MPQRASSAATRRASAASGVISAAVRPGVSSALAHRDGERQRLLALVVGDDQRDAGEPSRMDRRLAELLAALGPKCGRLRGPQRLAENARASA